ncbi:hypothetical protein LZ31DRAFT_593892 [Colletotrichum somersetense]|nr:hypothetical protein LZ31DRAFT_593892 [Colletotrichum somersetense]
MAAPSLRKPTIEMPLMSEIQAILLEVLDRGCSFYELSLLLPDVGKDLAAAGMPTTLHTTVDRLSLDHLKDHQSLELLHVAPRRLLVSMIQGTVAYDCTQDPSEDYSTQTDHPGVYVIAIVATFVDEYIEASEILERGGSLTVEEEEKVDLANRVVTAYGVPPVENKARFVEGGSSVRNLREISDGLRRCMIQPYSGEEDARRHQTQAPQYVGCSTKLSRRLKDYDVATGLESQPVAERLFIALARSYLWQDGFNIAEGGESHAITSHRLQDARHSVWAEEDILRTNLDLTLVDVKERKEFLGNID